MNLIYFNNAIMELLKSNKNVKKNNIQRIHVYDAYARSKYI